MSVGSHKGSLISITSLFSESAIYFTISDLPIPGAPHIMIGLCNLIQCVSADFASLGETVLFCEPIAASLFLFALAILYTPVKMFIVSL